MNFPKDGTVRQCITHLRRILLFIVSFGVFLSLQVHATGIVANCTESDLRTALAGGGTVTFACDGVIELTNTLVITNDTTFDATGHEVTLSGGDTVRVIQVQPGVDFTAIHLRVVEGRAEAGGGLFNAGGIVSLVDCEFSLNRAVGTNGAPATEELPVSGHGGPARGGAIWSSGSLHAADTRFLTNSAIAGDAGTNGFPYLSNSEGGDGGEALGGAIYSEGTVWLTNCIVGSNHSAGGEGTHAYWYSGHGGIASGGAIWSAGTITAVSSLFENSTANAGRASPDGFYPASIGAGGFSYGGAIYSIGNLALTNSRFRFNRATGGRGMDEYLGGAGGDAFGGALVSAGETATIVNCIYEFNSVESGLAGDDARLNYRGDAYGGAICNTGTLHLVETTIASNAVFAARAGGGGVAHMQGSATITRVTFAGNQVTGDKPAVYYHGDGLPGMGGGFYNADQALLLDTLLDANRAIGGEASSGYYGNGSTGGEGRGGGLFNTGTLRVERCTLNQNEAVGGLGSFGVVALSFYHGDGGAGVGGGVYSATGSVELVNTTMSNNRALGRQGRDYPGDDWIIPRGGDGGPAMGGGVHVTNTVLSISNLTITANQAIGGRGGIGQEGWSSGVPGIGGGGGIVYSGDEFTLVNSIVTLNSPNDLDGSFTGSPNMIGGDPRLGVLKDNGGPTPTLALMPDSPARDAGVMLPGVTTDQRGVARTFGSAPDLGAYEWNGTSYYDHFELTSMLLSNGVWRIAGVGPTNQPFRLVQSENLSGWTNANAGQTDQDGLFELLEPHSSSASMWFYRVVSP